MSIVALPSLMLVGVSCRSVVPGPLDILVDNKGEQDKLGNDLGKLDGRSHGPVQRTDLDASLSGYEYACSARAL